MRNKYLDPIKLLTTLLLLAGSFAGIAQHKLVARINSSTLKPREGVFMAGNFNGWHPGKLRAIFNPSDSSWLIEQVLPPGKYEFKFTRGSWEKVETTSTGTMLPNRSLELVRDTLINISIAAWSDDPGASKKITASPGVLMVDSAFAMPQLSAKRRIWIYLPPGYKQSNRRYPVIYMHDGQNLFDESRAANGEWGIDETLDSLSAAGTGTAIVVGIENGPERLREYNPFNNDRLGEGLGKAYINFIAQTLKPYVDRKYRTLPAKEHTAIAGSSMGGLVSYYAALAHPAVFGKAGIFSPSFWIAPELQQLTDSLGGKVKGKLFFYIGEEEGGDNVELMEKTMERLGALSSALIYSSIDPEGKHNEQAWRRWFPEFYRWIMADWTNYIIRPNR